MSDIRFSPKYERLMEERFALEREMWRIFDLVVAEWESDPTSVQCFDLRMVEQAKMVHARLKKLRSQVW